MQMSDKKKSISLGKGLNLTRAQQVLLLSVMASSVTLGVAIALSLNFIGQISFNARVIMEKDQAIESYSSAISKIGICLKPKGSTYTDTELKNCNPSTINVNNIPGTLRYNIINGLAVDFNLNSVSKNNVDSRCVNPDTLTNYTIKELNNKYIYAETIEERESATTLLKTCSSLRVIPDALPAYRNQEAFLSSMNQIFLITGWMPDTLAPNMDPSPVHITGLNSYSVGVSMESDVQMAKTLLQNLERSIRTIDINSASISYSGADNIEISIGAGAYYVNKTELKEETRTIDPNDEKGKKKK